MISLEMFNDPEDEDEAFRAALALPVERFFESPHRGSVRALSALRMVAKHLGATVIRDLCSANADTLVKTLGGTTTWREAVHLVGDWLELTAYEENDLVTLQTAQFPGAKAMPAFTSSSLTTSTSPSPSAAASASGAGDTFASLHSWATDLGVADAFDVPARLAMPASIAAQLGMGQAETLGDACQALWSTSTSTSTTGALATFRAPAREEVRQLLQALANGRARIAQDLARTPCEPDSAVEAPLAVFAEALRSTLAAFGAGDPRLAGSVLGNVLFREEPARLVYAEEPSAPLLGRLLGLGRTHVEIALAAWAPGQLVALTSDCAHGSGSCVHAIAACHAVLALLERPSSPEHVKLRAFLSTPPWQRFLGRLSQGLAKVAPRVNSGEDRLAFVLKQRSSGALALSMVVQRRGARGWSKGAAISVFDVERRKDLIGGSHDRRIIDVFASTESRWTASALSDIAAIYRALEGLVGATNVFMEGGSEAAASIRRAAVRVVLEEAGADGFALRFAVGSQPPRDAQGLLALSPDREHLVAIDAAANEITLALLPPELGLLAEVTAREVVSLPPAALEPLLATLAPLQAVAPLELPHALLGETLPAAEKLTLRIEPVGQGGLVVELGVRPLPEVGLYPPGEGAAQVYALREGRRVTAQRTLDRERHAAEQLCSTLGLTEEQRVEAWRFAIPEQEQALDLVMALRERAAELDVEWPKDAWKVRSSGVKDLRLRVTERRDWFGLEGGLEIDGRTVDMATLLEALRRRRKYVQLGPGHFARIEDHLRERLQAADDSLIVSRGAVELGAAAPELIAALIDDPKQLEAVPSFHDLRARRARAAKHDPKLPKELAATLRPYQREGFVWLSRLAEGGVGACLADDMGLGKTLQTLAVLLEQSTRGPVLVLAPTSVVPNWMAEAERFAPGLRRVLYQGPERSGLLRTLGARDLLITSYALATRDAEVLSAVPFRVLVLDEAQALKNAQSQRTQAVRSLKAEWRIALTGTPLENHLGELWSLFRVVSPALLGGWEHFRERFARPIERDRDPERRRALAALLRPYLLRRTKQEVAPELPSKTELTRLVELSPGERKLYDAARAAAVAALSKDVLATKKKSQGATGANSENGQQRFQILAALTRLRLLACHPRLVHETSREPSAKLAMLVELVSTLRETGHRALVFSQFVGFLELTKAALEASGATTIFLHGGTPASERASLVAAFQAKQADVFLISLKAGGTGLNLTEADTVVHLDPWWNPAVEDQATDRAHRLGQIRPVTVIRLVARGTVEEAVISLHAEKRELARSVLEGGDGATPLNTNQLLALLEAGARDAAQRDEGDQDEDGGGDGDGHGHGGADGNGGGDGGGKSDGGGSGIGNGNGSARNDAHGENAPSAATPPARGAWAPDLAALDGLIAEAAKAIRARNATNGTKESYVRALGRFREFVAAGRARQAVSWTDAGEQYLRALANRSWPAPASQPLIARASLIHLRRAAGEA